MPIIMNCVDVIEACSRAYTAKSDARLHAIERSLRYSKIGIGPIGALLNSEGDWGTAVYRVLDLIDMCRIQMERSEEITLSLDEFSVISRYLKVDKPEPKERKIL